MPFSLGQTDSFQRSLKFNFVLSPFQIRYLYYNRLTRFLFKFIFFCAYCEQKKSETLTKI